MKKLNTKRKYKSNINFDKHWHRPIWKHLRQLRLFYDNYTCQRCKKKFPDRDLRAHHISYGRLNTIYEILDMRIVCENCHKILHSK